MLKDTIYLYCFIFKLRDSIFNIIDNFVKCKGHSVFIQVEITSLFLEAKKQKHFLK